MRIRIEDARRRIEPHIPEEALARLARRRRRRIGVGENGFDKLAADRFHGVERRQRVLKDVSDLGAAKTLQRVFGQPDNIAAAEVDHAAGNAPGRTNKPRDRIADRAFAGAGLADNADDLAGRDLKAGAAHDGRDLPAGRVFHRQIPDRQHGRLTHRSIADC